MGWLWRGEGMEWWWVAPQQMWSGGGAAAPSWSGDMQDGVASIQLTGWSYQLTQWPPLATHAVSAGLPLTWVLLLLQPPPPPLPECSPS